MTPVLDGNTITALTVSGAGLVLQQGDARQQAYTGLQGTLAVQPDSQGQILRGELAGTNGNGDVRSVTVGIALGDCDACICPGKTKRACFELSSPALLRGWTLQRPERVHGGTVLH